MFFRDGLDSRVLARRGPFDAMAMTIATVIFMFVPGETEKAFEAS